MGAIRKVLSLSKRSRLKAALEEDIPHDVIATRIGCSIRTVARVKHNLIHYGTTMRPKTIQRGRQPKITEGMAQVSWKIKLINLQFFIGAFSISD
jgi:uncharacterized protein YerC